MTATSFGPLYAEFRRARELFMRKVNLDHRLKQDRSREMIYDIDSAFLDIYDAVRPYTITTMPRMFSLYEAVGYVAKSGVIGDIVECGVWKGGSVMLICRTLMSIGETERTVFLYDTFEGMSRPTERDFTALTEENAIDLWACRYDGKRCHWVYCDIAETRNNVLSTGYPEGKLRFVKGKVEDTIPKEIPEKISLLRLDTDFYESTKHELTHLFPRLARGGVLAIDDYGSYKGCREAVDEYFEKCGIRMLLNRVDSSGYRIGVKI